MQRRKPSKHHYSYYVIFKKTFAIFLQVRTIDL